MASKIIQDANIPRLSPSPGIASTSIPISLKSGYLRVTVGSTTGSSGGYISIGENPVATENHYHITSYSIDVIKERMARQRIVGITTGPVTILDFGQNSGNPFIDSDYVTIEGSNTVGLNTSHNPILSKTDSSIAINFDSSSITSPNVNSATATRSVKISCLTYEPDTFFNIAEIVTLVSE